MGRTLRAIAVLLTIALIAVSSSQTITRGYVYSNIGSTFAWSGSAQAWSGSSQVLDCSDWNAYIQNDGTACSPGAKTIVYSYANAHAVVAVVHSPLVANNTFSAGSFTHWSSTNTGACANGTLFNGQDTTDQDGDMGLAAASSGSCFLSAATVNLIQTFSIAGASPASQTYSFWYNAQQSIAGNPDCGEGTGTVSIVVKINGTTEQTVSSPTLDGGWYQVSGTSTHLTNGSNTLTIAATLQGAQGLGGRGCLYVQNRAQPLSIDDVVLSATW